MRNFALESGTVLAQFTFYHPYPGTKDFHEFTSDIKNIAKVNFVPKHKSKMLEERFWLKPINENDVMVHPNIGKTDLKVKNKKCWDEFYSIRQSLKRTQRSRLTKKWPLPAKITYLMLCIAFRRIYGGQGMQADGVQTRKFSIFTKAIMKIGVKFYNHYYRTDKLTVSLPIAGS